MSYCEMAKGHPFHEPYHDTEYGFPVGDDRALFERLALEINQAGLSWLTILKKRDAFRKAFVDFDIDRVAKFDGARKLTLLDDAGIIRNRLKIEAVIENARRIQGIRREHGSFAEWLASRPLREKVEWVKLFRKTFVFTGGEITGSFLLSIGYLPGAHEESCHVFKRIARLRPHWMLGDRK